MASAKSLHNFFENYFTQNGAKQQIQTSYIPQADFCQKLRQIDVTPDFLQTTKT